MAESARYLFFAAMDVDPDKEALFDEVYDTEHIPAILQVPGVISARRWVSVPFDVIIGGERRRVPADVEPRHVAMFEIESPEVLTSEAWVRAVESGRWPGEVRPYTRNRRHVLRRLNPG